MNTNAELNTQDNVAEEQAYHLARCAIALDTARQTEGVNDAEMVKALRDNLDTWVAVRTLASREDSGLSGDIRQNLITLSRFVAERTFNNIGKIDNDTVSTLININLQISEGFLEGKDQAVH